MVGSPSGNAHFLRLDLEPLGNVQPAWIALDAAAILAQAEALQDDTFEPHGLCPFGGSGAAWKH
jgi:hypothetical protein